MRIRSLLPLLLVLGGCSAAAFTGLPRGVPILPRAAWGAAPPVAPMAPHVPGRITIHHTASPQNPARPVEDKLRGLQRFSQARSPLADGRVKEAWADIPYHFYVAVDGTIAQGRELRWVGDSNTAYDPAGHIQVVLEGNFQDEQPSRAQLRSLWHLTYALARRWNVPPEGVTGHRDHVGTLCPGEALYGWLPVLRAHLAEHL